MKLLKKIFLLIVAHKKMVFLSQEMTVLSLFLPFWCVRVSYTPTAAAATGGCYISDRKFLPDLVNIQYRSVIFGDASNNCRKNPELQKTKENTQIL